MSHRDSDSKRRHSKFDREPSPKRHRRDRERVTTNDGGVDREQRNLPLPNRSSKHETTDGSQKKLNPIDHSEPSKHSSQPSRSRSYYQVGRSAGQREADGKVYTQSKENNQRVETSQSREQRDEKSLAKQDDKFQRRNSFTERKDDPTPSTRKRPAFREKKIPVESGEANPAGTVTVKSSHTDHPSERNERKEDRSSNPNHLDRSEKQIADDRALDNREARRDGFASRARYGGNGGNSSYRGRDKFNGRQDYHPVKTQTEKWKHDLYQEVNKDPIAKNEDDQIAKLEALLAS
ncbi:unnamed protein product [Lathyrus oleraceus]|uniref:Uncharacterized protein n=1 Tax=Pisum sativum TaxID=3888 RepID=A0A9D4WFB3_PEA|nr:uncharacterized protein LOC127092924 [Pisum sativum]KAI5401081.1 hypothetical protein KIW84_065786 [Pisum sativum]